VRAGAVTANLGCDSTGLVHDGDGDLVTVLGALLEGALDNRERETHRDVLFDLRGLRQGGRGDKHRNRGAECNSDRTHVWVSLWFLLGLVWNPSPPDLVLATAEKFAHGLVVRTLRDG